MDHRATFTRMEDSTAADWKTIGGEFMRFAGQLPDRVIQHLRLLENDYGGFPVDRYTHCLQTATRALKDGRDEEYVVCALLHDIGDTLGSYNHADIGAAVLKPFVSEENHWMVMHHAIFQGYYFFQHIGLDRDLRDNFRSNPAYERTAEFCALYDNPAFDPKGETLPLAEFEPMLRRVMASPKQSLYKSASVLKAA
ncbi:HD domain-containing protein [Hydrogenophaga sp. PAMC20947]|uniref:HD domain-containing protein n=1 Tax=Hydrogenophaga sp. PAMC20947 TaxID=2565558 RepID=UPI00109D9780|nr:HD domain-containing protein [Hydrogenophaga sp. PAMC20947]QCB47440.1 HD domain-containing protein [Hydrogenophaga sp. PAMC20947]